MTYQIQAVEKSNKAKFRLKKIHSWDMVI